MYLLDDDLYESIMANVDGYVLDDWGIDSASLGNRHTTIQLFENVR